MDKEAIAKLSSNGSHQECLHACQTVIQTNPEESYAWKYAGKSLLALGQIENAKQCLITAQQLDQNEFAPALSNIGHLKRQSGNYQEAINLFRRAIEEDPKLIQAYIGAAASHIALGESDQAEYFANHALMLNESTPGMHEILGMIFQNRNISDKAIEHYQREIKNNPSATNSLINLGLLFLQKGQADAALESLTKLSGIAPSEQCSLLLAQTYQQLGQFKEASIEYKKFNIDQSKNKLIPYNLGLCLLQAGDNKNAVNAFKRAIQLDEEFIAAWGNMGTALKNVGSPQEALAAAQKVLELEPNNPDALINLGGIYKDLGNLDQALASTLKSLELNPDNVTAHINLGGIYKDLGNLDQALASTLKSLELNPNNPDTHMNLGGIYKDLGNLDQALAATLKSLEFEPNHPEAQFNLGSIYKDLGNENEAIKYLEKASSDKKCRDEAIINLAEIYYYSRRYSDGVRLLTNAKKDQEISFLLSFYLCLGQKEEFNNCAKYLIAENKFTAKSIAAIDHANIIYNQRLSNGLSRSTLDTIHNYKISENEISEESLSEIIRTILSNKFQQRSQGHLENGIQTAGNILEYPSKPFQILREVILSRLVEYSRSFGVGKDAYFERNLLTGKYYLNSWAMVMEKGGCLKYHNHEHGLITGTFYLQVPNCGEQSEEAAIEFTHKGPNYPADNASFERKIFAPKNRDLNIFSSALFHRTIPFSSETKRICVAFDVTIKKF